VANVKLGNALNIRDYFNITPKLVFNSPPYLNIVNYTQQNWIKMWMLGYETKEENKNIKLNDKHNINEYKAFMLDYLNSISNICNRESHIILVVGDVRKAEKLYSFDEIWDEIKNFTTLKLIEKYTDNFEQNKKHTNSRGTRSGKSTRTDKIFVFKKKF
jgi:hypothetical protein